MADKTLKSLNFGGVDRYFPLPLVTAADNDKILSVVNGEWAVIDFPGNSGEYVWSRQYAGSSVTGDFTGGTYTLTTTNDTQPSSEIEYSSSAPTYNIATKKWEMADSTIVTLTNADNTVPSFSGNMYVRLTSTPNVWYLATAINVTGSGPYSKSLAYNAKYTADIDKSYVEYAAGSTEDKYPDGGWSEGAYYILKLGKRILMGIEVTTSPTTVGYIEGDPLNLYGLVVTAMFSDGSTEDVTSKCTFSPSDGTILSITDTSVNISYTYKGVTCNTAQIIVVGSRAPYLSFLGNEDFYLQTNNRSKNWNGILEYSTDTDIWTEWYGDEIISVEHRLYLRGTGNTVITGNYESDPIECAFVFTGTENLKIACEGNIENLLDYEIVIAGGHPTMNVNCYQNMFDGCISLTAAPALPATTLANGCYTAMFQGCTSLTTAPSLPATTLADYCYASMFYGCTSLTTAPALPATTLADSCYESMFCDCTSLTTAPALPATTLVNYCYDSMFQGCSNIKLSTTKTGEYQTMYRIPKSGTGTTANAALSNMFLGTGGTFDGTPEINTTYYLSTNNTVV